VSVGPFDPPIKANLTRKRQVVLGISPNQYAENHVYFVLYAEAGSVVDGYYMNREEHEELGEPDTITVTIEAGDQLNEEPNLERFKR
jgi:hypothetical protein